MSSNSTQAFPANRYSVIYADPPWEYRDKCHSGRRGVAYKYPCMKNMDICQLPVADIAQPDCVLFLWATAPQLLHALEVISAWGFTYKTVGFVWVKSSKSGVLSWGMGSYTRSNAEFCLLATRGRLPRKSASVHQIILSPREAHSKKPDIIREKISALYGAVSRIELFARKRVDQWDSWGNELQ